MISDVTPDAGGGSETKTLRLDDTKKGYQTDTKKGYQTEDNNKVDGHCQQILTAFPRHILASANVVPGRKQPKRPERKYIYNL